MLTIFTALLSKSKLFYLKNKYSVIITGLFILAILAFFYQRNQTREAKFKLVVAEHNLAASTDTIHITKDKNDHDETNKLAFLVDKISNLEKLNENLYKEVKAIKGNVNSIVQGNIQIIEKPVPFVVKAELIDSNIIANFKFDTTYSIGNYRKLSGFTKYNLRNGNVTGEKTEDEIGIRLVTGIKNVDIGKPEIFIKSDYPGFKITQLDGAVIDRNLFSNGKPKVPLVTVGISIGWVPVTYDFGIKRFKFNTEQIGIMGGLSFNMGRLFHK